ncbi:MAG: response regulator [Desulfobacteraceae bacterium]|nr:response regulator [Desulfobacteraceae bacterium]
MKKKPDLVLLDIQMPGMDGFKILETIRKKSAFRDIPVLMLTSLEHQHLKIKGLELGADDYITKPFNRAELLARIKAALRRSERYRKTEGIMEGNLGDVGLSDLLQSMELGSRTASIYLQTLDAEIFVENGMLLHTRFRQFSGTQALTRIFLMEKGAFSIKFNEIPSGVTGDPIPLMSVLMGVLSEVDEVKDIVRKIKVEHRLIRVDDDLSEFPELGKFKTLPPMSFIEMLVLMDHDIKTNVKTLIKASKKGKLRLVKQEI